MRWRLSRSVASGVGCLLLTGVVMLTCLRIEWLNVQCGGILPRDVSGPGNPKWRLSARKSVLKRAEWEIALMRHEEWASNHLGMLDSEPDLNALPSCSREETQRIAELLREHELESRLYGWVSGPGLLQYVLAPALLVWSFVLAFRFRGNLRLIGCCSGMCALLAIVLMFHRAYYPSLGF